MTDKLKELFEQAKVDRMGIPEAEKGDLGYYLFRAGYMTAQKEDAALIEQLVVMVEIYRNEKPPKYQPHMIAHRADEVLKAVEEWRKGK